MRKITMLILLISCVALTAQAQWQSINPGAGGQVQDIVCDPNTPNRVFVLSDMEGFYESIDNGNSWHHKGNLKQNRAYALAVPYGNTSKMFVGTLFGLEVSTDAGNTFSIVTQSKNMSVAAIAVDPNNQNNVIAGVGWRDDGDFTNTFSLSKTGPVVLYRSTNGGTSWTTINITDNQTAERNVYTIQFDKTNSNNVYMGTSQGVYKSTNGGASWFPLNNNPGANSGVSLSANGQYLYGTFNYDLYVTSTSSINWQLKMSGVDTNAKYWYPEVDPRDNGSSHKVTMAVLGDRPGLYEGTFSWSGNSVSSYSWKKIWDGQSGYDTGWDQATPNPRVAHYTPSSWPSRALWSTTNQTIFQATPDGSAWGWNWNNKYSTPNAAFSVGGTPTYSSKGTASTYTYDVVAKDNYVLQGMADNGFVESWDNGFSWSNIQMRWAGQVSDVQAVDIGYGGGNDIAIAIGNPNCYGGLCFGSQAAIYTKKLINKSPTDVWTKVPGSDKGYNSGLYSNEGRYREVAVSPAKKDRVFFGVNNEGLFMIDDLGAAANGTSNLQFIGGAGMWIRAIAPHPTNADIFFFTNVAGANQGLYKATKSAGVWSLQLIMAGTGWDSDVYSWMNGSQVMVAYAANIGSIYQYMLSNNGGTSFTTALTPSIAQSLNTPSWYSQITSEYRFTSKGGLAGDGNTMFAVYYDHRMQQTYGIYKGTIASNGSVTWADWSGDVHFGGLTGARIITTGGTKYLYGSTAGAGAIRRPITTVPDVIPTSVSISGCPGSNMSIGGTVDLNETVTPSNATNKSVTWSSTNTSVATVNNSGLVTAVASGSATITVTTVSGSKTATCGITVSIPTGGCTATGTILKEKYDAISGTSISNLTGASIYPNSPSSASQLTSFEVPTDVGDNYGLRVRGLICAPQTGAYTFWIAGDDAVELWLSTTSSETNKIKIASHTSWTNSREWNKFSTQKSVTISLTAGQSYYVEALMKEGTGGDNLAVGWRKPGDGAGASPSEVIPGSVLSPAGATTTVIPTGVSISGCPGSNLAIGATADLNETVSPANASNKSVTWTSSNASVATVSNTGLVTAIAAGSATITVTTVSGNKTATCSVTVNGGGSGCSNPSLVTNGEFDSALTNWTTYSGQNGSAATSSVVTNGGLSGTNSALINITNGGSVGNTDVQFWNHVSLTSGKTYEVIYKAKAVSNRTMRVQLHQEGGTWAGYGEHTINLTTSAADYSFELTMPSTDTNVRLNFFLGGSTANVWIDGVIVREKCTGTVVPTGVSISGCPSANLTVGAPANLDETVSPSNATNKAVTWSTSNSAVATVSNTGLVTAVAAGSATITVTTVSGSKTATCVVTVSAPVCNNPSVVTNGEFDSGTNNWQLYVNTNSTASWAVVSGAGLSGSNSAKATISNGGGADSDIQLYSNLGSLTNGKTYQVTFKAKAAGSRAIRVGVLKGSTPWTNYLSENVNLTTSVQDYTLDFTMNENSSDARVDFFIGNNTNDVWIDNVAVKEKCAGAAKGSNSARLSQLSDNAETASAFVIYPNPVSIDQVLTIDLGTDLAREVQVLSATGQVIFSKQYAEVSIIRLPVADMRSNNAGLYLIRIQTNNQQKVQKLIIK